MKFLPTILLLLPLLTACNSELDFGGDTPGTKKAVIGFSNNMKITRAEATLTDDIQPNGFSVWGGYDGNTVFDGRKVTFVNSAWGYEDTEYWTYNTYDFHGVYPTPDANSTDKNYTVTWNNTTKELKIENFNASNNIDLLHAPVVNQNGKLASVTSQPVTMNFNHILTNVNVVLKKQEEQEEQEIKIVKAAILLPTVGDYSWPGTNSIKWSVDEFSTKTLTFDYSAESKTLSDDQYTTIIENLLCIPQEITANAITLRVDYSFKPVSSAEITENREYYVTLPAGIWNPGDKVVYQGVIDAHMNIVFGAPTVEEWGEDMAGGTIIIK